MKNSSSRTESTVGYISLQSLLATQTRNMLKTRMRFKVELDTSEHTLTQNLDTPWHWTTYIWMRTAMMTLQPSVMASLSWWAAESDASLWENTAGMARKVLWSTWDGEALMQIGCENDWPAKGSEGDGKTCQHLCFSCEPRYDLFIYSQKFRRCLEKFDKPRKLSLEARGIPNNGAFLHPFTTIHSSLMNSCCHCCSISSGLAKGRVGKV